MTTIMTYKTQPGEEMGTPAHLEHIQQKYKLDDIQSTEVEIKKVMELMTFDRHNAIQFLLETKIPVAD